MSIIKQGREETRKLPRLTWLAIWGNCCQGLPGLILARLACKDLQGLPAPDLQGLPAKMPLDGKFGPIPMAGTITAEDRQAIWDKT